MPRVDLHTHLLPGIDDGPDEMADSLEMARVAGADGTGTIVATPHQRDVMMGASVQEVQDLVARLNAQLRAEAGPTQRVPRILLGMENHIEPDLPAWFDQGIALPINGTKFILTEPPFTTYPGYMDDVLFELQLKRLVPIIAHPERNTEFQRRPGRLRKLIERGMFSQITAGSLLGDFGNRARAASEYFLQNDLAHAIASDMHTPFQVRTPNLSRAAARAVELVGRDRARALFEETPRSVIDGRDPELTPPRRGPVGRRRWWWPFGRAEQSL